MEELLTQEEIEYFKNNQHLITQELLDTLRAQGKDGKRVALEILDTPINERAFHVDAFGLPISFDGNKGLKKPGTIMKLSDIHISEFERCALDFNYFRENYIQIKTPKGIDFPDMRDYQSRFINKILDDNKDEIAGLLGRQCVSGDTVMDMEDRNRTLKELFDNPEI